MVRDTEAIVHFIILKISCIPEYTHPLQQMALTHDDYPKYLMAPETCALLHYEPALNRKMQITTLWNNSVRGISQQ